MKLVAVFRGLHYWLRRRIAKPRTTLAIAVVVLLAITFHALSFTEIGRLSDVGAGVISESALDFSALPQPVVDDAVSLANQLFQDSKEKRDAFIDQVLGLYSETRDKDFVVLFNSGGWGWNVGENSPDWQSILDGIGGNIFNSGYSSLILNYQRSVNTLRGYAKEMLEMANGYSNKGKDLASRVEFLTSHNAHVKVILAGESNGSMICDSAMVLLEDNPRVYTIQTGPPFWHKSLELDRKLMLKSNGVIPDSFSDGDFITVARANLRSWLGLVESDNDSGTILLHMQAPGHQYSWWYPEVRSRIDDFLGSILD